MQRTWKQYPKQSVYDIRLYTKKPRYQKLHGAIAAAAASASLDLPLVVIIIIVIQH